MRECKMNRQLAIGEDQRMPDHPANVAVILLNMGGPDSLESVPRFMRNLFSDRDIFKFPFGPLMQPVFARMITAMRTKKVRAQYAAIGGKSPILDLTQAQAVALEAALLQRGLRPVVAVAMRYWKPLSEEALRTVLLEAPHAAVIALPLYPHYSNATTGSSLAELKRVAQRIRFSSTIRSVQAYYDRPKYIEALSQRVEEALKGMDESTEIFFSAHGLPESFVRRGDPYVGQIERTFELVKARFPDRRSHLAYQSRVGPVKWIGPSVEEKLEELSRAGVSSLLVVPVSFVSDHIETLYEIDVTYRKIATNLGISNFQRIESLNCQPAFIDLLADLVVETLQSAKEPT